MGKDRESQRRGGRAIEGKEPPGTPSLDETVTKAFAASARFFKRYRIPLLIAAGATLIAFLVRAIYFEVRDARVDALEDEADRLTHPEDPDAEPDYERMADLVARSSGTLAEKEVVRTIAHYLWERREPRALRKAREYAERAKSRFREEKDVQEWTERMLAAIRDTLEFQLPTEAYGPPAPARTEAEKAPSKEEPAAPKE